MAKALAKGEIKQALKIKQAMGQLDEAQQYECCEIIRQNVIGYLKKGLIYKAREAERLFELTKESIDDTVKQAVLSSLREGDVSTIADLKSGLPIPDEMAEEIANYCSTWGKDHYNDCLKAVFA